MVRHRARRRRFAWASPVVLIAALGGGGYYVAASDLLGAEPSPNETRDDALDVDWCTPLRVVTASSFKPVLADVAPLLTRGDVCVQLEVDVANGLDALSVVADSGAHVWIPDDASWAGVADRLGLDTDAPGWGTVVATSPYYMVTDEASAGRIRDAGGGWLGLATLASNGTSGLTVVVQEPERSGDGLVAAGSLGEAVWQDAGMHASAQAMTAALASMRRTEEDALPAEVGEVGLVPEYVLARMFADGDAAEAGLDTATLLPGDDNTAALRFAWLPSGADRGDLDVVAAMDLLLNVLTSSESNAARAAAGLRGPDITPAPPGADTFPPFEADLFEVFSPHAVDHVFATFYAENRRADVHLVIDISSSMAEPPPGSNVSVLDLVKAGLRDMTELLPDDANVGLWQFGTQLSPPDDWVELVPIAALEPDQRQALDVALADMIALDTGTGLYNTILDAYLHAQEHYQTGIPSHAVVFTDGHNEFRPGTLTVEELTEALAEARDPERPVQLTVVTMGTEPDAELLADALEPVENYLAQINTADEIRAVVVHLAAGGVNH